MSSNRHAGAWWATESMLERAAKFGDLIGVDPTSSTNVVIITCVFFVSL